MRSEIPRLPCTAVLVVAEAAGLDRLLASARLAGSVLEQMLQEDAG